MMLGAETLGPRIQSGLRAGGDHRRLVFGNGGQDVDGQAVGLGEIRRHEIDRHSSRRQEQN
jgi:hypothetical protein